MKPEDVTNVRFRATRMLNPGYDMDEVDDFLDEVALYLRAVESSDKFFEPAFSIASKLFTPTKWREGYNEDEVDDFLDKVDSSIKKMREKSTRKEEVEEIVAKASAKPVASETSSVTDSSPVSTVSTDEKALKISQLLLGDFAYVPTQKMDEIKRIIEA